MSPIQVDNFLTQKPQTKETTEPTVCWKLYY